MSTPLLNTVENDHGRWRWLADEIAHRTGWPDLRVSCPGFEERRAAHAFLVSSSYGMCGTLQFIVRNGEDEAAVAASKIVERCWGKGPYVASRGEGTQYVYDPGEVIDYGRYAVVRLVGLRTWGVLAEVQIPHFDILSGQLDTGAVVKLAKESIMMKLYGGSPRCPVKIDDAGNALEFMRPTPPVVAVDPGKDEGGRVAVFRQLRGHAKTISFAPVAFTGDRVHHTLTATMGELGGMTRKQLLDEARRLDVAGDIASMKREHLVGAIQAASMQRMHVHDYADRCYIPFEVPMDSMRMDWCAAARVKATAVPAIDGLAGWHALGAIGKAVVAYLKAWAWDLLPYLRTVRAGRREKGDIKPPVYLATVGWCDAVCDDPKMIVRALWPGVEIDNQASPLYADVRAVRAAVLRAKVAASEAARRSAAPSIRVEDQHDLDLWIE